MEPVPFSVVSAITLRRPGRFDAEVSADWTVAGKPNGGYLLAMLARAATTADTHVHVLAASAHYLHSPDPGPVVIDVEVLRAGRSASQVRARLAQAGRPCVEALITTGTLATDGPPRWTAGLPTVDPPDPADCLRIPGVTPLGAPVPMMRQVEIRLDPAYASMLTGRPSGRGELRGWLSLPGGESFDPTSLVYAVDAFPPATFDIELTGWVPTLELTTYVRALPADGPVFVQHRAQLVDGGRVDEDCLVWDRTGRLVASSTQLAGIRLA